METHMRDVWLITHFIGLALGVGSSAIGVTLGLATRKLSPEERKNLMQKISVLPKVGSVGLILLLVSGFALLHPYLSSMKSMPMLHVKLTLVGIMLVIFGTVQILGRRVRLGTAGSAAKWMPRLGMTNFILTLGIIVTAVLAFH